MTINRTKILLHILMSSFVFRPAVAREDVARRLNAIVMKPIVKSEKDKGTQLPLLITPVIRA